ncbi:MAG TPA: GNAT family N-acetyltransferase [Armatimonadota bacterium]
MSDLPEIRFRRLAMEDLALMRRWLNETPAVRESYAHGQDVSYEAVVGKYGPRIRGEQPTASYIIMCGDEVPIGYIQTYLWRDYPAYARYLDLHEEAASLDVFIGHEGYIHRGLGPGILRVFLREVVFADARVESCVITPEAGNASALRAYEKAGFRRVRVIEHPDEPGPVCMMRIGREGFAH